MVYRVPHRVSQKAFIRGPGGMPLPLITPRYLAGTRVSEDLGSVSGVALADNLVTTNLAASYRADTEVTDSSGVSLWGDPISGWDLAESTNKPTYVASGGPNDQPYVSYDSNSYTLYNSSVSVAAPCHIFFVLRQTGWVLNAYIFRDSLSNPYVLQGPSSSPQIAHTAGIGQGNDISPTLDQWVLVESCFNGASSFQRVNNGTKSEASNVGSNALTGFRLGWQASGENAALVDYAEIAIYGTAEVTGSSLTQNLAHFNDRYTLGL
jgi:uncharacterized protein YbjQ (UPF0145 family)